jgi:PAS domain S-box-containing protein
MSAALDESLATTRSKPAHTIGLLACVVLFTSLIAWLKFDIINDRMLPIGYGMPLCIFLLFRDRRFLWPAVFVFAGLSYIKLFYWLPHHDPYNLWRGREWIAFMLVAADLLLIASIVHVSIGAIDRRATALAQLNRSNVDLLRRDQEIARQNQELQSQAEELERQTEELRVSNDELVRREQMMESLLSLSRALAGEMSSAQTLNKVCHAVGELIDGQGSAAIIVERRGEEIHVICQHGFGDDGLDRECWPAKSSFSSIVLERNRTGYIENLALRSDLVVPQPKSGPAMKSVLSTPLRVRGRNVGALEVYRPEPQSWSDEQINIIESLAAQTSISLEATSLFEEVEKERARLSAVLMTIPVGVAICNERCQEITYNPAAARMLGVTANMPVRAAGTQRRWQTFAQGREVPRENSPIYRAAVDGDEIVAEERELIFRGGRRLTLLVSASPLRNEEGAITGAVSAFSDVTELKRLQLELDSRRRQAEEETVRKGRLLAAVSHDIRTPANAIGLLAELLVRTGDSPARAGEIPQIAQDMRNSALSLVNLVTDVLDLTRYDAGHVDLSESEFSLGELLEDESRQYEHLARGKGLNYICNTRAAPQRIRTDRVKLSRVLSNLIGNAIKFTDQGNVVCEAELLDDGRLAIRVSDTGPGIPPEHREQIFDEYFQLKNTRRAHQTGSGLGLAISRRLVEAMGGTISVTENNGQGSTFIVTLPASSVTSRVAGRDAHQG